MQTIADMVLREESAADIGTDHGYIPAYLVSEGICPQVILTDINEAPLKRAERYFEESGLKGDFRLGPGLEVIKDSEISTVIIAGMGGGTGSGAAPIIAEIAQRLNLVVFSIAINPFSFESARVRTAKDGISHLRSVCPMTVVVENDLVMEKMSDLSMKDAFGIVNKSVSAYISKQQRKVTSSFLEQFAHLGDFVRDSSKMPEVHGLKGVASN